MSLFNFLTKTYGYNKPILANEVEYENYPKQQIYKELSELCKAKKIVRLERGVYFIPKKTKFGTLIFNTTTAIEKKYICDNDDALPAMWETHLGSCGFSCFANEEDLMKDLKSQPEYKQYFV